MDRLSLLDLDHSELESQLFSHLSELGRRDESGSDATDDDVDLEQYNHGQQKKKSCKRTDIAKQIAAKRSATKTGRLVGDLGSRGRARKAHEVCIAYIYRSEDAICLMIVLSQCVKHVHCLFKPEPFLSIDNLPRSKIQHFEPVGKITN